MPLPFRLEGHVGRRKETTAILFSLTQPLIEPEPMFDESRLPVPLPVAHFRELTHLQISEPEVDSAQEKRLQHTVMIRDTTSLQGQSITPGSGIDGFSKPFCGRLRRT